MLPDEAILRQRPVNAVQRLGTASKVLLLSLKNALRAIGNEGPVLLSCVCEFEEMVPPLLRAARDNDSILVLSPGGVLADVRLAHRFFELVRCSAEAIGTTRPIVVLPAPVLIETEDIESTAERIHSLVDAGFTGVTLRLDSYDQIESVRAMATVAQPAIDLELGLEVLLAPGDEEAALGSFGALDMLGARPDIVGVLGGSGEGLLSLSNGLDSIGVSWREFEDEDEVPKALRNALAAGARMVTVQSLFRSVVCKRLPKESVLRIREAEQSQEHGRTIGDLIGEELRQVKGDSLDRVESFLYSETEELMSLLRLVGSSKWIKDRLQE